MSNPLAGKIGVRDVFHIVSVTVAVAGSYFGLSAKMDYAIQRLDTLDSRVWELQGDRRALPASLVPESCPADATRVVLR